MADNNRRIVLFLAFSQTITWASIFYSFPALLPQWETDLGWSKTEISGAFTCALIVSAVAAPLAGRIIDRGRGAALLTGSPLLGAIGLLCLSQVTSLWEFYLAWLVIGLAMAGGLYEACFAFVTHVFGTTAKSRITTITLIAGLAGTVSFPSAHALSELFGWRGAVICFALATILISVPLAFWASRLADETAAAVQPVSLMTTQSNLAIALRSPVFWLLGSAFALVALAHGVLLTHLLPLLAERGVHAEAAVLAAAMIGPMQVTGRLAMMALEKKVTTATVANLCFLFMALAAAALYGVAAIPVMLVVFVVMHGAGYGVTSIVRPVVTAEFLGRGQFGVISGALAIPYMGMAAAAPTVAALIWSAGGYDMVIVAAFCAVTAGFVAFLTASRLASPPG